MKMNYFIIVSSQFIVVGEDLILQ